MSTEDNKRVVRMVEEAWDGQKVGELDQHFSQKFDNSATAVPGMPAGLEGAKMAHQASMQAMPDRKVTIEDLVAEGDRVVVRTRVRGTNTGGFSWLGIPANGNKVDIESISIYRLADGKIVEHRALNDVMSLMMQLGAIPPMG